MRRVFYGGVIHIRPGGEKAEWILVEDGVVRDYGVGPLPEADEYINIEGGHLYPGFIDCHTHLVRYGLSLFTVDLRGVESLDELVERLRAGLDRLYMGWLLGRGWDQDKMVERRYPTRDVLDQVSREVPIYIKRVCGHIAAANSKALELAGIDRDTPDPEGGAIDRDETGEPTGILRERAMELIEKILPQPDEEMLMKAAEAGIEDMLSRGVTTAHLVSATPEELMVLEKLNRMGRLRMRVRVYFDYRYLDWLVEKGFRRGDGDERLRFMGIKIITDGSLGGRTAYLSQPYSDDPSTRGVLIVPFEELRRVVKASFTHGFQLAIHGIGDAAIENIIKAYGEEIGEEVRRRRDRIEHASVLRPDLIDKIVDLGIAVSTQPQFITSDTWVVDRLGERRARYTYPLGTLARRGVLMGFGSDCPVEIPDPVMGVYAAVTRGRGDNVPLGLLTPDECLGTVEALKYYTEEAAKLSHDEELIGTLERGKRFDAVLLDREVERLSGRDILDTRVVATFVDGLMMYQRVGG